MQSVLRFGPDPALVNRAPKRVSALSGGDPGSAAVKPLGVKRLASNCLSKMHKVVLQLEKFSTAEPNFAPCSIPSRRNLVRCAPAPGEPWG